MDACNSYTHPKTRLATKTSLIRQACRQECPVHAQLGPPQPGSLSSDVRISAPRIFSRDPLTKLENFVS